VCGSQHNQQMKKAEKGMAARLLSMVIMLSVLIAGLTPTTVYAMTQWPALSSIEAEGGILVDGSTGTVLYAKNENRQFYPASITKILTALLVIENCSDLDATFEFSHRAVYDVEANSQNAGYDEGDVITVRDALYAMLLQSANEVANGLAEYVGGSIEGFADMMNEYAASIGCTNSHFANPSGLNDPEHYTTAADYAKICIKAFDNETFREIDGTTYYKLPASKRNPEPFTVYTHHGMLKKNNENYYPDAIGGKTGYTSLAGNTLVTCAERDGLRLITVVLNGHQTHYSDTKAMLDFGFGSFKSLKVRDYEQDYTEVYDVLDITSEGVDGVDILTAQEQASVVVPRDAGFNDLDRSITYSFDKAEAAGAPEGAVAKITYTYDGREVGEDYLTADLTVPETPATQSEMDAAQREQEQKTEGKGSVWRIIALIAGVIVLIAGIAAAVIYIIRRRRDNDMGTWSGSGSGGGFGSGFRGGFRSGFGSGSSAGSGLGSVRGRSRRRRR
jgi:serine-type D-Ala-D-Ala carboxypeptidase (penicillin-binding protein 5/6)